jgi:hypothetical protein
VTSALAGLAPKRARGKRAVLRALHIYGPMHDERLSRLTGLRLGSAAKRRHDLQAMGLVEAARMGDEQVYAKTTTGSPAIVWRLTFAGRAAAQQLPPEEDDQHAADARREARRLTHLDALLTQLESFDDERVVDLAHELRRTAR